MKKQESERETLSPKFPPRKQKRKVGTPVQFLAPTHNKSVNSFICSNALCRADRAMDEAICKRCTCFLCSKFDDDNKDPHLWLECSSESGQRESCGFSCHIECAFTHKKVGVVNLGQGMELDGSYYCAACGKVSKILECWKKLLTDAKEANHISILCHKLDLSFRLLNGTSRYKELHKIVEEAKSKLESEIGPLRTRSGTKGRGVVSKLSVASDVRSLCSFAVEKADKWSAMQNLKDGSIPEACVVQFEEVTSSSVTLVLIEVPTALSSDVQDYKLWYCKTSGGTFGEEPDYVICRPERRVLISNLQPSTEYSFRVVSYIGTGKLGHSEARCSTRNLDMLVRHHNEENPQGTGCSGGKSATVVEPTYGSKIREMGKTVAFAQEQSTFKGFSGEGPSERNGDDQVTIPEAVQSPPCIFSTVDLNMSCIPDINGGVALPVNSSREEQNELTLALVADSAAPVISFGEEQNQHALVVVRDADVVHESENGARRVAREEVPDIESPIELARKRPAEEAHYSNSIFPNGFASGILDGAGPLNRKYEYCVKIISDLGKHGHLKLEFCRDLLLWFSLRATENQCRVVYAFIDNWVDRPSILAKLLIDAYSEINSNKRPKVGCCSKFSDK